MFAILLLKSKFEGIYSLANRGICFALFDKNAFLTTSQCGLSLQNRVLDWGEFEVGLLDFHLS